MPARLAQGLDRLGKLCYSPLSDAPLSATEAALLAPVLAALGDPDFLRLLSLVAAQGEVYSCHLEKPLGKRQPTVSHHTRVPAEAALIVGERRSKWIWWTRGSCDGRFNPPPYLLGGRMGSRSRRAERRFGVHRGSARWPRGAALRVARC